MESKRGFITVATGDYYCWLAQNLAMSYRLFSNNKYPIYAITDKNGINKLNNYYDGLIVLDKPYYTFMDKMMVYEHSPFEETIFIDADANIVDDISFLFDEFDKNGSEISCLGTIRKITDEDKPFHFGNAAIQKLNLDSYIAFNGGVYYLRKSKKADCFFEYIFDSLVPNYAEYELRYFRVDQMADEPLFAVGMLMCGMKPLDIDRDIMRLVQRIENLSWDLEKRECKFVWYGYNVTPIILHYGTHNTYTKKYVYYNSYCKLKYHNCVKIFYLPIIVKDQIALFFRCCRNKSYREDMWQWFSGHFTRQYVVEKWNQFNKKDSI